uniref:Acrosin-binding protein n=2 Tax=Anas TaxID=8835 RepID=A0A8B9R784_ANAPL
MFDFDSSHNVLYREELALSFAYGFSESLSGWGCTAGPRSVQAQQPGAPLSSHEYRRFFRALRVAHHAATACHLRALYGCQNPLVRRLDEYENHGVIPKGPVCSELPGTPFFPNFCAFASYRCTMKWYFIKVRPSRPLCPGLTPQQGEITRLLQGKG